MLFDLGKRKANRERTRPSKNPNFLSESFGRNSSLLLFPSSSKKQMLPDPRYKDHVSFVSARSMALEQNHAKHGKIGLMVTLPMSLKALLRQTTSRGLLLKQLNIGGIGLSFRFCLRGYRMKPSERISDKLGLSALLSHSKIDRFFWSEYSISGPLSSNAAKAEVNLKGLFVFSSMIKT